MKVSLGAGWGQAAAALKGMSQRWNRAVDQALMKEAHLLRGNIVRNIASGGQHAGKPFKPLSPNTLAIRKFKGFGGSKPLVVTGALRSAVSVVRMGAAVFVGIRRAGKGKGGANLASLHEFGGGPWTRPMTAKQRRFLMAALKNSGASSPGTGGGMLTIRIPARPFVGPTVDRFHAPKDVQRRFWQNVSAAMGGVIGKP